MKNFKILLLLFILMGCSTDASKTSAPTGTDGKGGSLAIFALKGNYLYGVDYQQLNIFSLLNTAEPTKVNTINVGFNIETLFSYGEYLFIGSQNGMFIYSITNPENPTRLSSVQHFTACDPVVANSTHSFVTLHSVSNRCGNNLNVLQIYNTIDPTNPILVHSKNLTNPKGLGLYNNYLIVCDDVLKIFSIQNPSEPVLVKSLNKNCFDVIIKDNDLYAIGNTGLYRYLLNPADITDVVLKSEVTF
jgi:hypothetical protein